jgi:hypothetical protein
VTRRGWALLGSGLWLLAFLHSAAYGVGTQDESWFLRVLDRVAEGDALYGDVWFNTTPLAAWLGVGPVAVLGSELLVVKAVAAAVLAGTGLAVASVARSLGVGTRATVVLAVLCVVVPGLRDSVLYTPLALALVVGALAALLRWDPRGRSRRAVVLAGGLAGLALATKHNVGALAVVALAAGIVVRGGWTGARRVAAPTAAAAAAGTVLPFVPVLLTGDLAGFLEYGITAKGTYLDVAGESPLGGARHVLATWRGVRGLDTFEAGLLQTGFLALPVAAAGLAVAVVRATDRERRGRLATVALFAAVIAASLYPRADVEHLRMTLPTVFLVLAIAAHDLLRPAPARRVLGAGAALLAAMLAAATLAKPPVRLAEGSAVVNDVPHLRGVLVGPEDRDRMRSDRRRLLAAARRDGPILALGASAAYVQLLGDLESPTPYDYALVTGFGHDGEEETAEAVRRGRIGSACITASDARLTAARLEAAVRETLPERADLGVCRLYAR